MTNIITCKNLGYTYKTYSKKEGARGSIIDFFTREYKYNKVLKDIDLEIKKGEIIGLLGSNGAGKTTLIKVLTGILKYQEGSVDVLGFNPIKSENAYLSSIGVLFGQKSQLIWDLTPLDTLLMLKEMYKVADDDFYQRINHMFKILNIEDFKNNPVRKLSLGQKVKFDLVCALFHYPDIVFLDEPTIGLDIMSQNQIHKFLRELNEELGITIVLTSHYIKDIESMAGRIIYIKDGEIIEDCSKDKLFRKYSVKDSYIIEMEDGKEPILSSEIGLESLGRNKYKLILDGDYNIENLSLENLVSISRDVPNLEDILIKLSDN